MMLIYWADNLFSFKKRGYSVCKNKPQKLYSFVTEGLLLFHLYFFLGRGNSSTAKIKVVKKSSLCLK